MVFKKDTKQASRIHNKRWMQSKAHTIKYETSHNNKTRNIKLRQNLDAWRDNNIHHMGPEIVWVGDERPLERLAEEASLAKSTGFDDIAILSSEGSEKPNPLPNAAVMTSSVVL